MEVVTRLSRALFRSVALLDDGRVWAELHPHIPPVLRGDILFIRGDGRMYQVLSVTKEEEGVSLLLKVLTGAWV